LTRSEFREELNAYRRTRRRGDKEHRRQTDIAAGSVSPQKLYGVPVDLMFFEGAPRLLASNVTIPRLQYGDPKRIAVEAYPGVLARQLIGNRSYKQDTRKKQTSEQRMARLDLLNGIVNGCLRNRYGLGVKLSSNFAKIRALITSTLCCAPFKQRGPGKRAWTVSAIVSIRLKAGLQTPPLLSWSG